MKLRIWLRKSMVGPIILAVLFGTAVRASVMATKPPLHTLLALLINRLIRQARLDVFPLAVPDIFWLAVVQYSLGVIGLLAVTVAFAFWMYPETRTRDTGEPLTAH